MTHWLRKATALVCIFMMMSGLAVTARAGDPADDLKQIEYKYYFRGKYTESIDALQTFLARIDVKGEVAVHANEFLAASHVLAGSPQAGKDVFAKLIATDPSYAGPDAAVFKPEVVDVYAQARTDYAARTIKSPAIATTDAPPAASAPANAATPSTTAATESKPIYKKWWFYAGAAAVIGGVAAVAGGGGGGDQPAAPRGGITVGVTVK
ncbi:MAG TPA: hypothetical protein VJS69_06210 [Candidatus Krumholzibacteria bacterium]|nr:hypothetical protein [Candidatus Krumholzibacteria bacterium]